MTFATHLVGSLRRNYPACSRLPTAPEAEFQDTANSQDTHNLQLSRAYIRVAKPRAISYQVSPTLPSPGVHPLPLSRGTAQVLEEGAAGASPSVESSVLERDAAATNGALLESELRQGTGPRAGAPCRRKTLLLGTFSSKQSPEPLVPAATEEEWIPPRARAGAQMLRAITSFTHSTKPSPDPALITKDPQLFSTVSAQPSLPHQSLNLWLDTNRLILPNPL